MSLGKLSAGFIAFATENGKFKKDVDTDGNGRLDKNELQKGLNGFLASKGCTEQITISDQTFATMANNAWDTARDDQMTVADLMDSDTTNAIDMDYGEKCGFDGLTYHESQRSLAKSVSNGVGYLLGGADDAAHKAKDGAVASVMYAAAGIKAGATMVKDGVTYVAVQTTNGMVWAAKETLAGAKYAGEQTYNATSYVKNKALDARNAVNQALTSGVRTVGKAIVGAADYADGHQTLSRNDIKAIQRWIGTKDDGAFGTQSETKLKIWQEVNGLPATGKLDAATKQKLTEHGCL